MKALFIVADGFEDMEYTCPRDILRRGGVEVVTASGRIDTTDDAPILGREGIAINDHVILSMQDLSTFDILVIPGGGHYKILEANEDVISTIYAFNNNKRRLLLFVLLQQSQDIWDFSQENTTHVSHR